MTGFRGVGPPRRHVDRAGRPGAGGRVLQEGHRRRARQHALSPVALLTPGAGEETRLCAGTDTGQEEGESIGHLLTRASVLLQKDLSSLLLNRIPSHPPPAIGRVP